MQTLDEFDAANNNKCLYTTIDQYNESYNNSIDKFHIFIQNIRSFNKNYDELSVFLRSISVDIDVVVLTET